jgi:hypothetical protein
MPAYGSVEGRGISPGARTLPGLRRGQGAFEMQLLGDGDPHVRLVAKVLIVGAL